MKRASQAMTREHRQAARGRADHRRAGGTYVLVLGVSTIIMIIGLAAVSVVRIDNRNVSADNDWAEAQMLAFSAAEDALARIAVTEDWRSQLSSQVTIPMGRGTMQWQITDPSDGQLGDDSSEPVMIVATGQVGASRYKLGLNCTFLGDPLECLSRCLCAADGITMGRNAELTATGAPASTNGDFNADKNTATLFGDLEADGVKWKKNVTGDVTKHAATFQMPSSDVVQTYTGRAVRIYGHTLINRQAIGPGRNPYGAANADGVYYIDAGGSAVTIRDSRILGTLVVRCSKLTIDGSVLIENYRKDMPALIVDGDLELNFSSSSNLRESDESTNFNPSGVPYAGRSDSDKSDSYPSEIRGLVHVRGDVEFSSTSLVRGAVVAEGSAQCSGVNQIVHDDDLTSSPLIGYTTGEGQLRCDSWKRLTD